MGQGRQGAGRARTLVGLHHIVPFFLLQAAKAGAGRRAGPLSLLVTVNGHPQPLQPVRSEAGQQRQQPHFALCCQRRPAIGPLLARMTIWQAASAATRTPPTHPPPSHPPQPTLPPRCRCRAPSGRPPPQIRPPLGPAPPPHRCQKPPPHRCQNPPPLPPPVLSPGPTRACLRPAPTHMSAAEAAHAGAESQLAARS